MFYICGVETPRIDTERHLQERNLYSKLRNIEPHPKKLFYAKQALYGYFNEVIYGNFVEYY